MPTQSLLIERGDRADLPDIYALLDACGLPTDGLTDHADHLLLARDESRLAGVSALEVYADGVLLRSLAVDEAYRGSGLGDRLASAALDLAHDLGATRAYLLTTTAAPFFARRGFRHIAREDVPESVRQSAEFTSACPASADVMVLELTHGAS